MTFGKINTNSSVTNINFIALNEEELASIIGKLVYFDTKVGNAVYRSIGTVSNMVTENNMSSSAFDTILAKGYNQESSDLRKSNFNIQAVFKQVEGSTVWEQHGAALPTSPSTQSPVHILDDVVLNEMVDNSNLPSIGKFRGIDHPLPIDTPDFGGKRGAAHAAVVAKSGAGKTSAYGFVLGTYMRHEHHALLMIDPQGQWANESGMVFSPQRFARALGREVSIVRIGEDVKIPMNIDVLSQLMDRTKAWTRFRRMGGENQVIFSREVAEKLARENLNDDTRAVLSRVFLSIAHSEASLRRVYADVKTREGFRDELKVLAGENLIEESSGEEIPLDKEAREDVESNWKSILKGFKPLLNLFSDKNLSGGARRPFTGRTGVLTEVFKVRNDTDSPAPYVIIDMSPNVENAARAGLDRDNDFFSMQALLDDGDVKALLLQVLLSEMKYASEIAFSVGGGNLNTQIIFDEAWRFAPEGKASEAVTALADQLEGFALDTRKFGIGWTYILQSPGDLRTGIWRQLSYVYAGYGLVGEDVRRLEALTDDVAQLNLYRQFISPAATGVYPFMIMGSISPLIFTTSPTFVNIFTSGGEFLHANQGWIRRITRSRSLPQVTEHSVDPTLTAADLRKLKKKQNAGETRSYGVGKNYEVSTPQTETVHDVRPQTQPQTPDDNLLEEPPF